MIPKIIHYVWIGDSPKSDLILRCIESWRKFLPGYQIIEWNNAKLSEIENKYATQAFENKKWAFASDYIRLYALYTYGGFYFDSDLEIMSDIENFRKHDFVTGYENYRGKTHPITAFMGAAKGNKIVSGLLAEYNDIEFVDSYGRLDLKPNTKRISEYLESEYGLKRPYKPTNTTRIMENSIIYPSYYFCTPEPLKPNFSIHHFNGSWLDGYARRNIIRFGRYTVCLFKDRNKKNRALPLTKHERLICMLPMYLNISVAFLVAGKS